MWFRNEFNSFLRRADARGTADLHDVSHIAIFCGSGIARRVLPRYAF